jgi:hypothetical protein
MLYPSQSRFSAVFLAPGANTDLLPEYHFTLFVSQATLPMGISKLFPIIFSKAPAELIFSARNNAHILTLYVLHFLNFHPPSNVPVTEGQPGTACGPSKAEKNLFFPLPNVILLSPPPLSFHSLSLFMLQQDIRVYAGIVT